MKEDNTIQTNLPPTHQLKTIQSSFVSLVPNQLESIDLHFLGTALRYVIKVRTSLELKKIIDETIL